ncbi:MAG: hypothetical protein J6V39_07960 [Clostridia bacterium]|nr:hypothetical protein [Clostridia bacterium]
MKRRVLTLVLALITVLGMLAACATPDEQEQGLDNSSEALTGDAYDQALAKLTVDMKGDNFVVLGRGDAGSSVSEIMREEASSDPLENAVYNRNRALSEICKLNYIAKLTPSDALYDTLSNDIKAGAGEYAIAFPDMRVAGTMATKSMLKDFNDLSYINLDAEWWDQGTAEMSVVGKTFWMNSDINYLAHDVTFLTLFSKVMAQSQGLDDLYETVNNGEWTVDVFSTYAKKVSADLDGSGKYDENDAYGLIGTSTMGYAMFYGSEMRYVACDEDGEPYIAMTDTDLLKASDLLDKVLDLLYSGHSSYIVAPGKEQDALRMFINNQGLFYLECAGYINSLRNMSDDFGVLPLPKYSNEQERYATYVNPVSSTMVVPVGPKNYDDLSKAIETMAILSSESVIPTYYELVLKRKTVRDEESAQMLDIIFSNRIYDLACFYEQIGLMHLFQGAINGRTNSFSSKYSSATKKAEKELIRIVKRIEDIE